MSPEKSLQPPHRHGKMSFHVSSLTTWQKHSRGLSKSTMTTETFLKPGVRFTTCYHLSVAWSQKMKSGAIRWGLLCGEVLHRVCKKKREREDRTFNVWPIYILGVGTINASTLRSSQIYLKTLQTSNIPKRDEGKWNCRFCSRSKKTSFCTNNLKPNP